VLVRGEREPMFGGNDENAALSERDRAVLAPGAEQPSFGAMLECIQHDKFTWF
jgi:hypothetical protein